jgi:hypothetical protein
MGKEAGSRRAPHSITSTGPVLVRAVMMALQDSRFWIRSIIPGVS